MAILLQKYSYSCLLLTTAMAAVGGIMSSGAEAATLEEVIVTAQKRTQSLQDVPVAVSVFTGDKMEKYGMQTFEDITLSMPNVTVSENTVGDGLFVRGIGSGVNQGFEQSVGIFMDDVYYGRGRITRAMMFDIERVEILKGPQGILFGKNTIGGAMNITTRGASEELEGYVDGRYEFNDGETEVSAAVSGPLSDTFRLRLAARYRDLDGYIKNVARDADEPSREENSVRLVAEWDITPDLEAIARYQYGTLDIVGRASAPSACTPAYQAFAGVLEDCKFNGTRTAVVSQSPLANNESEEFDFYTMGLTLNWDIPDHTLTSVTSYVSYEDKAAVDGDFTDKELLDVDQQEEFDVFAQELRLVSTHSGPFQYIVGGYFEKTNLDTRNDWHVNAALLGLPSGTRLIGNDQDSEAWAIFAQGEYDLSEQWRVVVGVRYTEETKDDVQTVQIADLFTRTLNPALEPFFNAALNSQPHIFDVQRKTSDFNPSGTIEWRPNEAALIYGSVKTGFKAGGFDHGASTSNIAAFEYGDESVLGYELGGKFDLLDGAATLNIAAFYSTFEDLQVSTFDGAIGFTVGNAGEVTSKGVEVDGRWRVTEELTLGAAVAYLDSQYDKFPGAQCFARQTVEQGCVGGFQDLAGATTQFSPEWSGNFNIEYIRPILSDLELLVNVDINYTDDVNIANDTDLHFLQEAYTKINARIAIGHATQGWEVAVIGKNLTNKKTFNWGNDVPLFAGSYYKHLERGSTIAVQGRFRF